MTPTRRHLALLVLASAAAFAVGCRKHNPAVTELTVPAAAGSLESKDALFVDVNTDDFRKGNGKVPGALLVDNYRTYDAAKVLPADKGALLVFYCTSRL